MPPVAEYPQTGEADVICATAGCPIRPIRPEDRDALATFHEDFRRRPYYRFFAPYPRLTDRKDLA